MATLLLLLLQDLPGGDSGPSPAPHSGRELHPRVRLTQVEVHSGPLEQQAAHRAVALRQGVLLACYAAEVRSDPSLDGQLALRAEVGAHGRGELLTVETEQTWPESFTPCLERVVQQTHFELPEQAEGSSIVSFDLQFWLQPGPLRTRDQ